MPNVPRVIVDNLPPVFASHFLLTANEECLFIECSAGLPAGEGTKSVELPIHSRLAIPWNAAQRLATVLNSALVQHIKNIEGISMGIPISVPSQTAKLPSLEV